jgi:hypothetical protein
MKFRNKKKTIIKAARREYLKSKQTQTQININYENKNLQILYYSRIISQILGAYHIVILILILKKRKKNKLKKQRLM